MAEEKHSIGKTIYQLRTKKGWTQSQLAEKLNVSDKTISKWESDAGSPSIEFFPLLSDAFGVSIDYLMTGKMTSEDKDELIPKRPPENLDRFSTLLVNNDLQSLEKDPNLKPKGFKYLACVDDKYKIYQDSYVSNSFDWDNNKYSYCLHRDFFERIVNDNRVSQSTINYLISNDNGVWFLGFPYLIHECYKKNTKDSLALMERIIGLSLENNDEAFSHTGMMFNNVFTHAPQWLNQYGVVIILKDTIKLALERGDFKSAERFNKINKDVTERSYYSYRNGTMYRDSKNATINCFIASPDDFRMSQLDHDKTLSEIERHIQKSIHYGILSINQLVGYKDKEKYLDQIIRAIKKYPINQGEYMDGLIADEKWDEVNEYLVNNSKRQTYSEGWRRYKYILESDALKNKNVQETRKLFDDLFKYQSDFLDYRKYCEYEAEYDEGKKYNKEPYEETFIEHTKKEKDEIITNLHLEYHMYNKIENLTPDYFHKLMKENKYRDVLIDLCVRLETILEDKYKYDGELLDMVKKHCSYESDDYDEDEDEYDENWPYLSKLVRCRNNAVHRNTTNETMTAEEIEWCIDYICKMA